MSRQLDDGEKWGNWRVFWRTNGVYMDLGEQNRHPGFEFMDVEKSPFHNLSFKNSSFIFSFFFIFLHTNSHRNSSKLRLAEAGNENLKFQKMMKIFCKNHEKLC